MEKLQTPIPLDIELRGEHDAALAASIANATRGWTYVRVGTSPRADRLVVHGQDTQKARAFVLFDGAGKRLASHAADTTFFGEDGAFLYVWRDRFYDADGHELGKRAPGLSPITATTGVTRVLATHADGWNVELFVLDPLTGATTSIAPARSRTYVAGSRLSNGTYCMYERPNEAESVQATLECAAPPWTEMKPIFVHDGGGAQLFDVAGRVVSAMDGRLDVIDLDGKHHVTYTPPIHGTPTLLGDRRTIAIKGDDAIALVDVVDETYAMIALTPAQVSPLACAAKAFLAQDGGPTASLVRYE